MKKLLISIVIFTLIGCAEKKSWTKDALVNDCLGNLIKKNEKEKRYTSMEIALLCDCMADKMLVKYKSVKESNRDKEGATAIGRDCAMEVLKR
ncbi:MAG: hypothetical protein SGI83_16620 [Bacteroidota bacterium]|nr:hypothetical protein [Bacteroidota bacterium]